MFSLLHGWKKKHEERNGKMCNWTRETFCIYRIFVSRRVLQAWTPRELAVEFGMLQNCIVAHTAFRWFLIDVDRRPSANASTSGFSHAFRETISAGRERGLFCNKKNSAYRYRRRWNSYLYIRDVTSRIVIHPL